MYVRVKITIVTNSMLIYCYHLSCTLVIEHP